jgi:internalin A
MSLQHLMVLDLSYNRIESIPLFQNMKIQELNLKGNCIRNVDTIYALTMLSSLDVSDNDISTIAPLGQCSSLGYLDISGNKIPDVDDILSLNSCTSLKTLWLLNTPAANDANHRSVGTEYVVYSCAIYVCGRLY